MTTPVPHCHLCGQPMPYWTPYTPFICAECWRTQLGAYAAAKGAK